MLLGGVGGGSAEWKEEALKRQVFVAVTEAGGGERRKAMVLLLWSGLRAAGGREDSNPNPVRSGGLRFEPGEVGGTRIRGAPIRIERCSELAGFLPYWRVTTLP